MTKLLFILILIAGIPIQASADTVCPDCEISLTDDNNLALKKMLISNDWQEQDGSLWRFHPNGTAVVNTPYQSTPLVANWDWKTTGPNVSITISHSTGQRSLSLQDSFTANNAKDQLVPQANRGQLSHLVAQLQGQWHTSLGGENGNMSLQLANNGTYHSEIGNQVDNGFWILSPNQKYVLLFSKMSTKPLILRLPYIELDEMVLEPVGQKDSWFFNRI